MYNNNWNLEDNSQGPQEEQGQDKGQCQCIKVERFNNPVYQKRLYNEFKLINLGAFRGQVSKIFVHDTAQGTFWIVNIIPNPKKYNGISYNVSINFPDKYPFQPPTLHFVNQNQIQHPHPNIPNVDKIGQVHLDILQQQNWSVKILATDVLEALLKALLEAEKAKLEE